MAMNISDPYTQMIYCYTPPVFPFQSLQTLTLLYILVISGCKLSVGKSELMPLNTAANNLPLHSFPFKVVLSSLVCRGVHATNRPGNIFRASFAPLLTRTKNYLEHRSLLHFLLIN